MAYTKQNFVDGQMLDADHLNHMETGIKQNDETITKLSEELKNLKNTLVTPALARIGEVTLLASNWIGSGSLYSQVINLAGVTENSQVDLTPSVEQLAVFYQKDITFVTENVGGVVTVYVIGQKPENDYTIQVTITEVAYD